MSEKSYKERIANAMAHMGGAETSTTYTQGYGDRIANAMAHMASSKGEPQSARAIARRQLAYMRTQPVTESPDAHLSEDTQKLNHNLRHMGYLTPSEEKQKEYDSLISSWDKDRVDQSVERLSIVSPRDARQRPEAPRMQRDNVTAPRRIETLSMQTDERLKAEATDFDNLYSNSRKEAQEIVHDFVSDNPDLTAEDERVLTNYLTQSIYTSAFSNNIMADERYWAAAYEASTGERYADFKSEETKKARERQHAIVGELTAIKHDLEKKKAAHENNAGQSRGFFSSSEHEYKTPYGTEYEIADDALDYVKDIIEGDFGSGFLSGFDFGYMASFGRGGVYKEEAINEAMRKKLNGEALTEAEEYIVKIVELEQEAASLQDIRRNYNDVVQERWLWGIVNANEVGRGLGTTIQMAPEFAVGMTGVGGIGSYKSVGSMATMKSALKAGGKDLYQYGVRTVGKLGYNYSLAKGRGFIAAPFMPSTYAHTFEMLNSGYKFAEDGTLEYVPIDTSTAYIASVVSMANEVSSEEIGLGFSKAIGWGAKGVGNFIAKSKIGGMLMKGVGGITRKITPQTKAAMRAFGVQSDPISETFSEAWGDIMTTFEHGAMGMKVDANQYATVDYWMTLAGVTILYGGGMATTGSVVSYAQVRNAVKERDRILGSIQSREVYDTLVAISTSDDVVMASAALADLFKRKMSDPDSMLDPDMKNARAFVVADLNVKVMQGVVEETSRLESFRATMGKIKNIVYQGKAGEYSDLVVEGELEGQKVYVINGLEEGSTTGQLIVVDPATGEKQTVDASKVTITNNYTVEEYIQAAYVEQFSLQEETARVQDIKAKAMEMENPTEVDVQRVASTLNISLPKVGDAVMLANGNMGAVTERLSPAEYAVQDMTGATYKVHFTDILSTDKLTATAQGALARGEVSTPMTSVPQENVATEAAVDENGITMGSEVTVDGRVGKVRSRTENGDYVVSLEDENGNYENAEVEVYTPTEMASLMGVAPMPSATTESTTEGTPTTTEVATTEDGRVDIEQMSAEDAAKVLVERAGTIEEAIAQVKQVIETVTEERKKMAKEEKKASLNDVGKKSAELQALDTRLEFYGEVLGVLEAMLAEQQKQTMKEARNIAEEAGVATTTTGETTNEGNEKSAETPTSGLIRNGAEMKFTDNVIRMVDFIAQRLGVTVEFVDDLKNEAGQPINGDIKGKHVRISTKGDMGVKFIVGHEFFHRIKDNVDEATYNKYIGALKEFFGEELREKVLKQKRKYRAHNVAVAKKSMEGMTPEEVAAIAEQLGVNIEGLSAEDAKDVVARVAMRKAEQGDKVARALFPTMLTYSDALMLEETAADISGEMVANLDAFSNFVEDNKSEYAIIRGMHKALRYIHDMFASFGQTTRQRKVKRLVKSLEDIMAEAVKNERKGAKKAREDAKEKGVQESEKARSSLIGEQNNARFSLSSAPIFFSNAQYAVQNIKQEKATPEQWLKMIEKNGGLKAGEDKWLGLSDWLKASDKKTLSKEDVLQYIAENDIQIEEVSYGDVADISREEIYESAEFAELREGLTEYDEDDNPHINRERYDELRSESYDFVDGFTLDYWGEELEVDSPAAAATYLGLTKADKEINETRLGYTTQGLNNKREIALVAPTIEPYNKSDEIHFGDAGEGRAVAWIRFGETETPKSIPMHQRVDAFDAPFKNVAGYDVYAPEGRGGKFSKDYVIYGKLKDGSEAYIAYIGTKPISKHETLEEARNAMNEYYAANPHMITRYDKVLVIDEIQSKRHQDGREKGYSDKRISQQELYDAQEAAFEAVMEQERALADKYGEDEWASLASAEEMTEYERLRALDEAATNAYENYDKGVPSAPFEKNWAELAFKRMLRYAAENGYDYVAWTTGDQQADRYDIGSVVKDIVAYDTKDADGNPIKKMKFRMNNMGTYNIATNMEGVIVKGDGEMKEGMHLSDITGKPLAEKIMKGEGEDAMVFENGKDIEAKSLEGEELHIGNEGMKAFYDQMLPSFVKKYTKKWGAEVGEVTMPDLEENNTMHAVNVTDSMRESVMQGQPKFSLSEETTQIFDAAKAKFGTTYDMREAGYILPDGSMLDFSGRHQVEGDASFLNGDRTVDHREISDIAYDNDDNETGINTDLGDFLDRGAIRIDSNAGAINLNVAPTKAQKDRLKRLIERNDGYVYVDFGKGWDTEHYAEYEAARASRVLGDIDRYFDEGIKPAGNVKFSLQETNDRFNAELATLTEENKDKVILSLGTPSEKLLAGGVVNKPMKLYGAKVIKKQKLHGFDLSEIKNLPLAVANPIAVFNNYQSDKNRSVLTELTTRDGNFLVSLNVGKGEDIDFNIVATVFGKGDDNIVDWFNRGLATYIDKEKALDYLHHSALNAEALSNPRLISATNIIQNFQNPKIETRNSLITPEMDATYLDAVERGDMETAQRMVMEAAKLAMPNTKVVDEDGNPKVVYHGSDKDFTVFDRTYFGKTDGGSIGKGFYFAVDKNYAEKYYGASKSCFVNLTNPVDARVNPIQAFFLGSNNVEEALERVAMWKDVPRDEKAAMEAEVKKQGTPEVFKENEQHDGAWYMSGSKADEVMVLNPNQIKSADPVTYDDNGNVIPLSERFNPENKDIRYSISSEEDILFEKKTAFLTDLVREYNIPLPTFIAQTKAEFKRMALEYGIPEKDIDEDEGKGCYCEDDNIILINGGLMSKPSEMNGTLLHEHGHYITISYLSDRVEELANRLNPEDIEVTRQEVYGKGYSDKNASEIINELVSFMVGRLQKEEAIAIFEGQISIQEFIDKWIQDINGNARSESTKATLYEILPLVKDNIELQKKQYGAERASTIVIPRREYVQADGRGYTKTTLYGGQEHRSIEAQPRDATPDRRGEGADAQEVTRFMLPDPDPSEVFYDDIPIFDEQGNEIDFNTLNPEEAKAILDSKVRQMLEAEYEHNISAIRKEAREARQAIIDRYNEEKGKRKKNNKPSRTNAARIDDILGDKPFESLPLEDQALILIATGRAKIRWGDNGTQRGLASELGLTGYKGDKHAYRSIWSGATKSFSEVVHDWWESIGGQERGIDDQDLRNALIEAFQSVQSSKDAMGEIMRKYDDLSAERDASLAEVDRMEEKDLREAKSAYDQHFITFELSVGEERAAYHDRAAQFFGNQNLSRTDEILEDLVSEMERQKRKIERLKAENKDVYAPLAEGIQKSKDIILHALERLRMFAGMETVDLNDVARLINLVKAARSQSQVENLSKQATALVQRVSIKKAKANLYRLLSLKLSNTDIIQQMLKTTNAWTDKERESVLKHLWKVSRNGLRVSKAVHPDTKNIFEVLNGLVKQYKEADDAKRKEIIEEMEDRLNPNAATIDMESKYQDYADTNKRVAYHLFKAYLEMLDSEIAYKAASSEVSKARESNAGKSAFAAVVEDKHVKGEEFLQKLLLFNQELENLIVKGKDDINAFYTNREEHAKEIRRMGIDAIGGKRARLLPDVNPKGKSKVSKALQKANAVKNATVNAPYWTLDTVLDKIDKAGKDGVFYKYFMDKFTDSNDVFIQRQRDHAMRLAEAMREFFPKIARFKSAYSLFTTIMHKADGTMLGEVRYLNDDRKIETIRPTISSAMYILAMWRQPRYKAGMEARGITQETIDSLYRQIKDVDEGYIKFMDWINDTFLPDTRLEYDVVHRALYGGSMAKEVNYFPANVLHYEEVKLDDNTGLGNISLSPSALKERTTSIAMPNLTMNYFKVLQAHLQNMDQWASFEELRIDLSTLLSSKEFKNRLMEMQPGMKADGSGAGGLFENLFTTSKIATGLYQTDYNTLLKAISYPQKKWVAANIAYRFWTGLKQLSSIPIFAFYQSTDPMSYAFFGKALARGLNPFHAVNRAMNLSPSLRYRWESRFAGLDVLMRATSQEKGVAVYRGLGRKTLGVIEEFVDVITRFGMGANAAMDVMACAVGVNMIYDYEIYKATKGKREATEAEKRDAIRKAEYAFNSTQQSSEGAYMSAMQMEPALSIYTAYKNASMAAHRKRSSGLEELWRLTTSKKHREFLREELGEDGVSKRVDTAVSDIMQGFISDVGFAFMGTAGGILMFSLLFGWDDDDWDEYWQSFVKDAALSMLNGYAFGGLAGEALGSGKVTFNPALDELRQSVANVLDDKGDTKMEVADLFFQFNMGVDLKTFYNIAAGLENIFEEEDGNFSGAFLKVLNAPQGYLKAFVGDRREGESLMEYQTRIVRLNTIFDEVKYEDYFDEKGTYVGEGIPPIAMSLKQIQELRTEYEKAYRSDVLHNVGGEASYESYMHTEAGYLAACSLLGWEAGKYPNQEALQAGSEMHAYLYGDAYLASEMEKLRANFIGSEEDYFNLLMEEQKAKNDLINNYYEYIKQSRSWAH